MKTASKKETHQASRVKPNEPTVVFLRDGKNSYYGGRENFDALKLPLLYLWQAVKDGGKVLFYPQKGTLRTLQLTAASNQFPRTFQEGMLQLELLLSKFNPNLSYLESQDFK